MSILADNFKRRSRRKSKKRKDDDDDDDDDDDGFGFGFGDDGMIAIILVFVVAAALYFANPDIFKTVVQEAITKRVGNSVPIFKNIIEKIEQNKKELDTKMNSAVDNAVKDVWKELMEKEMSKGGKDDIISIIRKIETNLRTILLRINPDKEAATEPIELFNTKVKSVQDIVSKFKKLGNKFIENSTIELSQQLNNSGITAGNFDQKLAEIKIKYKKQLDREVNGILEQNREKKDTTITLDNGFIIDKWKTYQILIIETVWLNLILKQNELTEKIEAYKKQVEEFEKTYNDALYKNNDMLIKLLTDPTIIFTDNIKYFNEPLKYFNETLNNLRIKDLRNTNVARISEFENYYKIMYQNFYPELANLVLIAKSINLININNGQNTTVQILNDYGNRYGILKENYIKLYNDFLVYNKPKPYIEEVLSAVNNCIEYYQNSKLGYLKYIWNNLNQIQIEWHSKIKTEKGRIINDPNGGIIIQNINQKMNYQFDDNQGIYYENTCIGIWYLQVSVLIFLLNSDMVYPPFQMLHDFIHFAHIDINKTDEYLYLFHGRIQYIIAGIPSIQSNNSYTFYLLNDNELQNVVNKFDDDEIKKKYLWALTCAIQWNLYQLVKFKFNSMNTNIDGFGSPFNCGINANR